MSYWTNLQQSIAFHGLLRAMRYELRHARWLFCKHGLRQRVIERQIHDFRMRLSLRTNGISWPLYIFGTREEDLHHLLRTTITPGQRVFDLGANIGYYSLMFASLVGDRGVVHAVEPDPRNLALLRENITLNGFAHRIQVHPIAISNHTGRRDFLCHHSSNLNAILPETASALEAGQAVVMPVETVDIFDFLMAYGTMDTLRMDVEGHEVEILAGLVRVCQERMALAPDRIIFEAHPWIYRADHNTLPHSLRALAEYGYRIQALSSCDEERGSLKPYGYQCQTVKSSDFYHRGIYYDVTLEDAIRFICEQGLVRTVLLEKKS